ncbi:GroES-like protein [Aaosphaeria arxii CBS 175.79]|uniref:GroES-like protein n=1 Tax=Aaosphaeria arxii CBS 175.79 TaxID=1450172 RepID=A0A6A5X696_9PLEO|nr:GroES-like protein [Aaosphaeria arxii CBS 175.79]KAF2008442.1 GroES-like protein [Aaosphaeria arxii CBS 175.79]
MADRMRAVVQRNSTNGGKPTLSNESIPLPKLESHQLLVKISHVAQNPTDVQSLDSNAFGDGSVFGCDFVGTVEKIGEAVTSKAEGDVVAGLIWGGEIKGLGAYSEYTVADERISFKVPSSIAPEQAATVPLAAATSALALFSEQSLHIDRKKKGTRVLIWGGSSSVGLYAIQIAKLHGLGTITTCSPKNFDLVKQAGADHVFDYRAPDVVDQIRRVAPDLQYVFDTIGDKGSSAQASQAIREEGGGRLCTVRPGKANTEGVSKRTTVTDVLVWTAFLKEHRYGTFHWPPHKGDHDLVADFFESIPKLLEEGKFTPNRASIKHGLDAVSEGFQEYRDGKISGYKIVYAL